MCLPQAAPMLLTRNLLYTGLTRAKKLLIVLGNKNTVEYMIQNIDTKKMSEPAFLAVIVGVGLYAYQRKDGVFVIPIGCLKD